MDTSSFTSATQLTCFFLKIKVVGLHEKMFQ